MQYIIYTSSFLLLFFCFWELCKAIFIIAPRNKNKNLSNLNNISAFDKLINPIVKRVALLIKISADKEQLLIYQLDECGLRLKPNEYYARALVISGLTFLLCPLFYVIGLVYFAPAIFILTVLVYLKLIDDVSGKLKKKKQEVNFALPGFVRAILFQVNDITNETVQVDIIRVFEDYLRIAHKAFYNDVSRLISDMKLTGDIENSLRKFAERMTIEEINRLCNILIGIHRGENQQEALMFLSKDIDTKARENIKLELAKRKPKVKRATIPMTIATCISLVYTIIVFLFQSYAAL